MQQQRALDELIQIQATGSPQRRPREEEQVLDDLHCPSSLSLQEFEISGTSLGIVRVEQIDSTQDRRQRIIELVRKTIDHLSHRRQALGLNQLLLDLLALGDIAKGSNNANNLSGGPDQWTRRTTQGLPGSVAMVRGELDGSDL